MSNERDICKRITHISKSIKIWQRNRFISLTFLLAYLKSYLSFFVKTIKFYGLTFYRLDDEKKNFVLDYSKLQ